MNGLAELMDRALAAGSVTVQSPGVEWDAAQLRSAASACEVALKERGAEANEPVLVSINNRAADLAQYLAAWRCGCVAVPVHASSPSDVVAATRDRVGARYLLTPAGIETLSHDKAPPRDELNGASIVMFTSGSTGGPKGVVISGERLAAKIDVLQGLLDFRQSDVVCVPLSLTFIFGLWVSLLAMKAGACIVLMPKFSVSALQAELGAGTTVAALVPTMIRALMSETEQNPAPYLRALLTGGEPYSAALAGQVAARFPQAGVFDLFGSTEMGSCDFCLSPADQPQGWGTIGKPTPNVEFRIDADPSLPGGAGELQIRTPYAMLGYFDNPQANAAAYDGGFFRTGDMARLRADGFVELVGRRKDIISRGGTKISPLEMDSVFAAHPSVESALATGIADERLGQTLHMLVVPRRGARVDAEELRTWAATRVERYKVPDAVHLVGELPLGRTGKADRNAAAALIGKMKRG